MLKILDNKKLLNDKKYEIIIKKNIPTQAGLGGGSMNAASVLKFLIKKQNLKISRKKILQIAHLLEEE